MDYVKLEEYDSWGARYYAIEGTGLTPHGTADTALELEFYDGQRIHVKWPDNTETVETVRMRDYRESIRDHSQSYEVTGQLPSIPIKIHGLETMLDDDSFVELRFLRSDLQKKK